MRQVAQRRTGVGQRGGGFARRHGLVVGAATASALVAASLLPPAAVAAPEVQSSASVNPRAVTPSSSNGEWSALGAGITGAVHALELTDDTLYVGGDFVNASGIAGTADIAAWVRDDTFVALTGAPTGFSSVDALAAVGANDGTLYVGGRQSGTILSSGASNIGTWTANDGYSVLGHGLCGTSSDWCALPATYSTAGTIIETIVPRESDDSAYVGGQFRGAFKASPVHLITQWSNSDDTFWPMADGLQTDNGKNTVFDMVTHPSDDDTLYVAGSFTTDWGGTANRFGGVGVWSQTDDTFYPLGDGVQLAFGANNPDKYAKALAVHPSDDTVWIGGNFTGAVGVPDTSGLIAWSNVDDTYHPTAVPLDNVEALHYDTAHQLLYAAGSGPGTYNNLAVLDLRTGHWVQFRQNGSIGVTGNSLAVRDLAVSGPIVYMGGSGITAAGGTPAINIAKWTWAPPYGVAASNSVTTTQGSSASLSIAGQGFVGVGAAEVRPVDAQASPTALTIDYAQSTDETLAVSTPSNLAVGTYGVWATGVGGTSDDSIGTIRVVAPPIDVPSAPQDVTAVAYDDSILVSWSDPASGFPFTAYEARATKVNGGATATCSAAGTAASCVINSLTQDDSYIIDVRARNSVTQIKSGWGDYSAPIGPYTPSNLAPATPNTPTVVVGDNSLIVTNNPGTGGVTPYAYLLYVSGSGVTGSPFTLTTPSPWTINASLTPLTSYQVEVIALGATGQNSASSPSASVTPLPIPATPLPPVAVAGDGRARVTVTPGSGGSDTPLRFRVRSVPEGKECIVSGAVGGTCAVTLLTNGTSYTFKVLAEGSYANSPYSAPSNAVIPGTPPAPDPGPGPGPVVPSKPGAPGSASATAGAKLLNVSWTAASAPADGPVIQYRAVATPGGQSCTAPASATTCTITGLTDGRSYMVAVSALNAGGYGPEALAGPVIPASEAPGAPKRPVVTPGNGQLLVSVAAGTTGGTPDSYVATASPGGASCTVVAPSTECAIAGLSNGTDYTVTVVAKNAAGSSSASAQSAAVAPDATLPQAPATPGAPTVTPVDRGLSVAVTPGSGGGEPSEYVVTASPGGASCTVVAPATSCEITGLSNGVPYTVSVVASNKGGTSSASVPSAPVAPALPKPAPPAAVTALPGDGRASVVVTPGAGGGRVAFYRVTANPGGATCVISTPATSCTVTGLDNGTAYSFTATAINDAGSTPAAQPTGAVTPAVAITPVITPLPTPLGPGDSRVTEGGTVVPGTVVEPDATGMGMEVRGPGFSLDLAGIDDNDFPVGVADNVMLVKERGRVRTEGEGFRIDSMAKLYLNPPMAVTGVQVRAGEGVYLGQARVDAEGGFTAKVRLPAGVKPGNHVIQVVGVTNDNVERSASLGIRVLGKVTLTLDKGKRTRDKAGDRIITRGTTTGIPESALLTPFIRYGAKGAFERGKATIRVKADGSYTWQRKIARGKNFVAYVGFADAKSNQVTWIRIR